MAAPTSTNEVTARRLTRLLVGSDGNGGLWGKIKSMFVRKAGDTMTGRLTLQKPLNQVITGTGTAGSSSGSPTTYYPTKWNFDLGIAEPTPGDQLYIKIPCNGSDYGCYMSTDNGTTYYPVARATGASRLTTHYTNGACICVVFEAYVDGNSNAGQVNDMFPVAGGTARVTTKTGCWRIANDYDSGNTVCYIRNENGRFYAGSTGCNLYTLVCLDKDGKFSMLTSSGSGTGTSKTINTAGKFKLDATILYYTGSATSANALAASTYGTYPIHYAVDTRYSHNHTTTFTTNSPLYIECTIDSDGYWSPTTKCITQVLEAGKYYIYLGQTYSTEYQLSLCNFHPIYYYDGTNLTERPRLNSDDRTKLDGISAGANKVTSSTNGKIKIDGTDTTVYTHPSYTAQSAKGSATKVPQITTDATGHVTGITEVTISGVTPASHASSATTYGVGTTANYGHVKLATGDMNGATDTDGVAVSKNHTHSQYLPKSGGAMTGAITRDIGSSGGVISDTNLLTVTGSTDGFKVDYGAATSDVGVTKIYTTDDANAKISIGNYNSSYKEAIGITNGSAALSNTPTAPTAAAGTNTTQIATTAFVNTAISGKANDSAVVHIAGQEYITGEKCYKGGMGVVNSNNVGYVFFSIPPNGFGTKYENWDSSLKDGAHFREWRLCFPTGASYWGKIRITIGGNYYSFNASGVMSKTLNIAFNTSSCYLNVGAYDALGYNVEKEFRISDLVWNSTDARWEIIIHSIKPTSNNSFYFTNIELWCTNKSNLDYGRQINWVSTSPSIVTDTTYTNAWRNITFNWADQPVLQSPYGNAIFDDSMTIPVANGGTGKASVTANSYLKGNGTGALVERTYAEVRSDLGISAGANKVEASTTNGKIKIDGTDTTVYTHPSYTATTAAAKKIGCDATGHVVFGDALAKGDVGLGSVVNTGDSATPVSGGTTKFTTGGAYTELAKKLDKTTYEWNKEIAFGGSGKLCIGKFPMYDSNITITISSTTSTSYYGVIVIATQNINTSRGGSYTVSVYGDPSGYVATNLKVKYSSGSRNFEVYFSPGTWTKNLVHIQANALQAAPTDICTNVDTLPTTDLVDVINKETITLNGTSTNVGTSSFYAPTAGGTANYVLIGNGATSAPTWAEKAPKATTADTATKASYLTGFTSRQTSNISWGTLTPANGYTTVTEMRYTSGSQDPGAIAFGYKAGSGTSYDLSCQIDGVFYQREGGKRVLDESDIVPMTDQEVTDLLGAMTA